MLGANSAIALARSLDDAPAAGHCDVADGLRRAIGLGLDSEAAEDARERLARASSRCPEAATGLVARPDPTAATRRRVDAAPEPARAAPPAEAAIRRQDDASHDREPTVSSPPEYAALLPDALGAPDDRVAAARVDGLSAHSTRLQPYAYTSLALGGASLAAGSAMLALAWNARSDREQAAVGIRSALYRSPAEAEYRRQYSTADQDVVQYGRLFYGLTGAACVFLTTSVTLFLLNDESTGHSTRIAQGGR